MLGKRLEDLDYRIAQYRREGHLEERLRRRREALVHAHSSTIDHLEDLTRTLNAEEAKLGEGARLFHRGVERRMVEDIIAIENLSVFKAAGLYTPMRERVEDIEEEVKEINSVLERRHDHHAHLEMLEDWRADLYERTDRETRANENLLSRRLDTWLEIADREEDIGDLEDAKLILEDALMALEDAISHTTRVRQVTKRDLAVVANLQPPRTKQFLLIEAIKHTTEAYRATCRLMDNLHGIEHLQVHIRGPTRILSGLMEALLLDHYEGGTPRHVLRELHDHHLYLLQIRDALVRRREDVEREIEGLQEEEDELLFRSIDQRLRQRSSLNRW